jgi:hypothetical protein
MDFYINVQCVPEGEKQPRTFIAPQGSRVPISPVFRDLADLYPWMAENGWRSAEYVGGKFNPWRCESEAEAAKIPEKCLVYARKFRQVFASRLPKDCVDRDAMTAYEFAKLVQEQTGETFAACALAVAEVIPEVFANYWEAHAIAS